MPKKKTGKAKTGKAKADTNDKDLSATGIATLVEEAQVRLFHSPTREPFASFWVRDHWETWRIKSTHFEEWLSSMCYHKHGAVPCRKVLAETQTALAGRAVHAGPEERVHVRLASRGEAVYLDLGNDSWEAVRITCEGWEIVRDVPVKFLRPQGMQPLPRPTRGGRIDDLRQFLNLDDEDDWRLTVGWAVAALRPESQYPLLVIEGTHGSAKSTLARVLRALIDPNTAPLRADPSGLRDLAISANNAWCLGFDNLSTVRPWQSDALCRLSTGGGFSTRALYTNDEERIFEGTRPILMTGIDMGIERADLLDRTIILSLPPISEGRRETEAEFWVRFEGKRPSILGSLCDAVAAALRHLPQITLDELPRMADFAKWVCAAERGLGWTEGAFLEAYRRKRTDANTLALEASHLTQHIIRLADQGEWEGSPSDLLSRLSSEVLNAPPEDNRGFPKTPRQLSRDIRRLAPNLRQIGITIEFGKTSGNNSTRIVTIRKPDAGASNGTPG